MTFTATECHEAVQREIKQRERVYPRFIAEGKMSKDFAARQIAIFQQIEQEYAVKASGERLL